MMNKRLSTLLVLLLTVVFSTKAFSYDYTDYFPRSQSMAPPGGLVAEQVPMFVSIGFDDNGDPFGMKWAVDFFENLKNPNDGNPGTFDGTPARVTFFNTTKYIDPNFTGWAPDVLYQWQRAEAQGHETGNHTQNHEHGREFTVEQWVTDIEKAEVEFKKPMANGGMGLTRTVGFRTPFLEFSQNTLVALKQLGFTYDCSIEDPWDDQRANNRYYPWPYTLDEGTPQNNISPVPGLWELPVTPLFAPDGRKITGFDYNVWLTATNKNAYLDVLKHSLDIRMEGNRYPFLVGAHAAYYSDYWNPEHPVSTRDRQLAIEEFIQYAQGLTVNGKKVVRIVPFIKVIEWMRNPVPLFWVVKTEQNAEPQWEQRGPETTPTHYTGGDHVMYNGQEYRCLYWTVGRPDVDPGWVPVKPYEPSKLQYNGTISWTMGTSMPTNLAPGGYVPVMDGETRTLHFTPNAGYEVGSVIIDGVNKGAITSYSFTGLTSNVHAKVNWVKAGEKQYAVTATAGLGGTITPASAVVKSNGFAQFTVTADAGYMIKSVTADTASVVKVSEGVYNVGPVNADVAVSATFEKEVMVSLDIRSSLGGTTNPSGIVTVPAGTTVDIALLPETGYAVDSILVDGLPVDLPLHNPSPFTVTATANSVIEVNFTPVPVQNVSITVVNPAGGTVDPAASPVTVSQGSDLNITVTPKAGFTATATVDGAAAQIVNGVLTLTNIVTSHAVEVTFTEAQLPAYTVDISGIGFWGSTTGSGDVIITNNSTAAVTNWSYTITPPAGANVGGWNAQFTKNADGTVTITPPSWDNQNIPAGGKVSFGVSIGHKDVITTESLAYLKEGILQ